MSSGSGPQGARAEYIARRKRLAAKRDRELRQRATPGYLDLVVVSALVCGALVAALWLMGTGAEDGRFSPAMLVGGLLGSGSAALVSVGRPAPWWPILGARWIWRVAAVSGPMAALAVHVLLSGGVVHVLRSEPSDRLLIGFAAGIVAWRYLWTAQLFVADREAVVAEPEPEPVEWRL